MENLLSKIKSNTRNPVAILLLDIVILFLAILGLISILKDTIFYTIYDQYQQLILFLAICVAVLLSVMVFYVNKRKEKTIIFFTEKNSKKLFLKDSFGRLREVSDKHNTLEYLMYVFNTNKTLEVDSQEINRFRGERIESRKDWKPSPTPSELENKKLRDLVREKIEGSYSLEPGSDIQLVHVHIRNHSHSEIKLQKVYFSPHALDEFFLSDQYVKVEFGKYEIPIERPSVIISPGKKADLKLRLRQKWQPSDLLKKRGSFGSVQLSLDYGDTHVDDVTLWI